MDEPELLHEVLYGYTDSYATFQNEMWASKLGLDEFKNEDESLIRDLNELLQLVETDMTIFFRLLSSLQEPSVKSLSDAFYDPATIPMAEWNAWLTTWWGRVNSAPNREVMLSSNPKYVLRNWMAQLAIEAAEAGDQSICQELSILFKNPYDEQIELEEKWFKKRPEWARHKIGCSMLSCSS
tara:strand:- start:114 stop:659 length:546 start_codon:yes stop_codon:yes gene_type:complete